MHDGMQYDPIQGKGYKALKVGNPFIFKTYFLHHLQWELAADHRFLNDGEILTQKLGQISKIQPDQI